MNIQIKANISLTQQDLEQAIRDYVTANGFDLTDKEVEFSELPDGVDLLVATDSLPETTAEKPAPKRRSPQKKAEPKVEYPDPKDPDEAVEPEPVVEELVEEQPVQRTAEEIKASIAEKERQFNPASEQPQNTGFNPFADTAAVDAEPLVEVAEEVEPEAIFGQDVLDEAQLAVEDKPIVNTKSLFDTPTPEQTAPVKVNTIVSAKSIFG